VTMDLAHWQKRLESHFSELSAHRRRGSPERGIFGLEHGLEISEIQALAKAARAHIAARPPLFEHVLVWIVYSTEIGYRYSGDEYWQTFEEETPGWTINGDRYWIRRCFLWFQKEFNGVVPAGKWAKHFSIICWPITHAIVPRDLQRQLARILYELRHSFSAELLESPSILGNLIAARSWNATSRFQNFVEETQLVGQIAAALLYQGEFGTDNLIHQVTLRRIGEDLDRERRAREWLRGARRFAKERAQVRGLGLLSRGTESSGVDQVDNARAEVAELGIEPRLVLLPIDSSHVSWDVSLEIPDLSHLLLRFPQTKDILTGCRFSIAGAVGRPLARRRCLHGALRVRLSRWPHVNEVLLQFEQTAPQLEYLLRTECLLRPGPTWLFRIASDGLAYECRSLRVRPGARYILVSTAGPIRSNGHTKQIDLSCEGVYGAILELPQSLTEDWEEALLNLGLSQAKTIEVWPAGLSAFVWDGEGHGEWLASERPCLGIRTDHPLARFYISMGTNEDLKLEITPVEPAEPIFVELPSLPVGLHTVHISAQSNLSGQTELLGDLDVLMRIRESRPWSPGMSPNGPLMVQMDPATPTLEQLWEGRIEFTLWGPADRNVKCTVSLFEMDGDVSSVTKQLPPLRLPITTDTWRGHFEKHFRRTREAEHFYDTARTCELKFAADELGAFTVRCERDFTPLRWAIQRRHQGYFIRLIDDSGSERQPEVKRVAFETPYAGQDLGFAPEYDVPEPGGMYVARIQEFTTAIIVAPMRIHGLADLGYKPQLIEEERSVDTVLRILTFTRFWGHARLSGSILSSIRQREVLQFLTYQIFRILGGNKWSKVENALCKGGKGIDVYKKVMSTQSNETALIEALTRDFRTFVPAEPRKRVREFTILSMRFLSLQKAPTKEIKIDGTTIRRRRPGNYQNPEWLSELALRLASNPEDVEAWAGEELQSGVTRLLQVPTMARAARFLALSIERHYSLKVSPDELYADWRWP
jgi:hypothetical protein